MVTLRISAKPLFSAMDKPECAPGREVIVEYPPIQDDESFYIVARDKRGFDYPVHRHDMYELTFVRGGGGCMRVVGDSFEEIGEVDLIFLDGNLPHGWLQHHCVSGRIREITLQFSRELFGEFMLNHGPFAPLKELLANSVLGVKYGPDTIARVEPLLEELVMTEGYFPRFRKFLDIIEAVSYNRDYRFLVRSKETAVVGVDSGEVSRIAMIYDYIRDNFRGEIRQAALASMAGMTPQAFARYFKLRTGRTTGDFIMETRVAEACRQLYYTDRSVSEVCFSCGFRNVSHFCRSFKKYRGLSPSAFREYYRNDKITKDFNIVPVGMISGDAGRGETRNP